MAAPNRWAVREAAEATFFNISTGDAIVTLKTLKMTEVQTTGETVYARGGRGNAKLVGFTSDREATVTLQDAIFDNLALAMLTGNEISEGAKEINMIFETTVPDGGGAITIPNNLQSVVSVYAIATDGITNETKFEEKGTDPLAAGEYEVTGQTITFHADDENQLVRIYYTTMTDATAKTVTVTSDMFGGSFKVVCDVMVRDEATKDDYFAQFIIPNAQIEDDFTFSFSPEGDPSVLDITLEILKDPQSTDMWELVIYDDGAIDDGQE